jgi:FkbM family methyltransferase
MSFTSELSPSVRASVSVEAILGRRMESCGEGEREPQKEPGFGVLQWRFDVQRNDEQYRLHSGWRPKNLRAYGFSPVTVVDVGVAFGTPPIYHAFSDAYRVLIEPLSEWEEKLVGWTEGGVGEYHLTAAGASSGTITINVKRDYLALSSLHPFEALGPDVSLPGETEQRQVPITTLDFLLEERAWRPPFGLKIDTEGYEYEVIQGATELLTQTQFVIAEIMIERRFETAHSFADLVALMDAHGFSFADFLDGKKKDNKVVYLDVLFRRT